MDTHTLLHLPPPTLLLGRARLVFRGGFGKVAKVKAVTLALRSIHRQRSIMTNWQGSLVRSRREVKMAVWDRAMSLP